MRAKVPDEIQRVIDRGKIKEIVGYIERRNSRDDLRKQTTLRQVCVRFRLNQTEVIRLIEASYKLREPGGIWLSLSDLAYWARGGEAEGFARLVREWFPVFDDSAPLACRIIVVMGDLEGI